MATTGGPQDTPYNCARCGQMRLHRQDPQGNWHCLTCMSAPPQALRQQAAPRAAEVVRVQQKTGGGVVRSTIDLAKFLVSMVAIATIGTCVYVCGSVGKEMNDAKERRSESSHTPAGPTAAEVEEKSREERVRAAEAALLEERRLDANAAAKEVPPAELKKRRVKFAKDIQSLIKTLGYQYKTSAQGKNGEDLVFSGDPSCDESALFEARKGIEGFTDYAPAAFATIRCAGKNGAWIMANP